jgi:hypothetical protein
VPSGEKSQAPHNYRGHFRYCRLKEAAGACGGADCQANLWVLNGVIERMVLQQEMANKTKHHKNWFGIFKAHLL